jgi:hypothetical protein
MIADNLKLIKIIEHLQRQKINNTDYFPYRNYDEAGYPKILGGFNNLNLAHQPNQDDFFVKLNDRKYVIFDEFF